MGTALKRYLSVCLIVCFGIILISPVVSHQEIFGEYDGHSDIQPFRVDLHEYMTEMPNRLPIPGRDAVLLLCAGFLGLSHIRRRK